MLEKFTTTIADLVSKSGFALEYWQNYVMIAVACFLFYLAIKKRFEPLLLLPIAFGMLLANLPNAGIYHSEFFDPSNLDFWTAEGKLMVGEVLKHGGLLDILYLGVKLGIYPPLIFLGIGAMTDFGPLITNPKSFILGAAAQLGIFIAFLGALALGMTPNVAGSIGIIGGADGPTAIYVTSILAPEKLGPIAVAAYSYMALIPVIQPPVMRLLTTKKERSIKMKQLRPVTKLEKIIFPVVVTIVVALILPDAATLVGMLMLGNLLKECGVTERLSKTATNELMNIVTIFLGISVGATTNGVTFLTLDTLKIVAMGLAAFICGTAGGVLFGKLMCWATKGKINPLIGAAGVSAVPMAARVAQAEGQREDPSNFLLMHAMGPNVAGVIGSAVAAGVLISTLS
ncbi:MAG: sodium ion-translocating decarboxylase subunit beta [Oscillospiraceae bacterium]|nr:sodium ion-translocating decarboxylase subunit beta [Oscillospiraceae bacterium]